MEINSTTTTPLLAGDSDILRTRKKISREKSEGKSELKKAEKVVNYSYAILFFSTNLEIANKHEIVNNYYMLLSIIIEITERR